MLGLEQLELDSLKRQHESKSAELADTQHRLLEERAEMDRILSDVQRKETELSKVKQVSDAAYLRSSDIIFSVLGIFCIYGKVVRS